MNPAAILMIATVGIASGALLYAALRAAGVAGTRGRVYVAGGRLRGPGVDYLLSNADLLWLARAVTGETGGQGGTSDAAVIWAIAQNFVLVRGAGDRRPRFAAFAECIRSYCQPVNPEWTSPTSAKCLQTPSACTADRIARRQTLQAASLASLPAGARNAVASFAAGTLANPVPDMVDWAAFSWNGAEVNIGGNWFGVGESRRVA